MNNNGTLGDEDKGLMKSGTSYNLNAECDMLHKSYRFKFLIIALLVKTS